MLVSSGLSVNQLLRLYSVGLHCLGNEVTHSLHHIDEMPVDEVGVGCRRAVPPVPERLADQRRSGQPGVPGPAARNRE